MGNPSESDVSTLSAMIDMPASQQMQTLGNGSIFTLAGVLGAQGWNKDSWALLAAAALTFIFPLLVALRQRAMLWLTPAGAPAVRVDPNAAPPTSLKSLLVIGALMIGLSGCAANRDDRLVEMDRTFIVAADALNVAIQNGLITDESTLGKIREATIAANAARKAAHAATQPADAATADANADAAVARLVKLAADVEGSKQASR